VDDYVYVYVFVFLEVVCVCRGACCVPHRRVVVGHCLPILMRATGRARVVDDRADKWCRCKCRLGSGPSYLSHGEADAGAL
jgi:hypothetical protein